MSHYKDYYDEKAEEEREHWRALLKDKEKWVQEEIEKGHLAELIADLYLNKQNRY